MKYLPIFQVSILMLFTANLTAQDSKYSLELRFGTNQSDMNYGTEPLEPLMPKEDYVGFSNIGDGGNGYSFGFGVGWSFGKRFELMTNIDYVNFEYESTIAVLSENTISIPPNPRPDVPVTIAGDINYNYLNIEAGIRYSFNDDRSKGFFVGAYISDMIHLNTEWNPFVTVFEDRRIDRNVDYSEIREAVEFNDLYTVGVNLGYKFKLIEKLSVAPLIDFRYGLNPVVDVDEEVLNPMAIGFQVQASWAF